MRKSQRKIVLPLLGLLKGMKSSQRVILLSHLDDKTRDALYQTINSVLKSETVPARKRLFLRTKLLPFKSELRYLASKTKTSSQKRKKLTQMGGAPLGYILATAIPLLLNLYSTK
jgi:hypothetical protein